MNSLEGELTISRSCDLDLRPGSEARMSAFSVGVGDAHLAEVGKELSKSCNGTCLAIAMHEHGRYSQSVQFDSPL